MTVRNIRARVLPRIPPREIDLRATDDAIEKQLGVGGEWEELIPVEDFAATVAIGTVSTLAPDAAATVENVGTPREVILDFGIPAGSDGLVQTVVGGDGITVDATNPNNPIISAWSFATVADAAAFNPGVAPDYTRTAGYSAAGDGGGALHRLVEVEPSHAGKYEDAAGNWYEIVPEGGQVRPEQFGATLDVLQAAADRRAAFDSCLSFAAETAKVFVSPGTWILDQSPTVPSHTRIEGFAIGVTTITIDDAVARDEPVLLIGGGASQLEDVEVSHLTVDFNRTRWDIEGGAIDDDPRGTALPIFYAKNVTLRSVEAKDGFKHCFDVSGSTYGNELGAEVYESERSEYVRLIDCRASGAGDDCFTTHQSDYVWFERCVSDGPWPDETEGHVLEFGSRNGIEFDDGTRYAWAIDCISRSARGGFDAHCHTDTPAPRYVHWIGCLAEDCIVGFALDDPNYTDLTSLSPTARDFSISNCSVRAPGDWTAVSATPVRGIWIQAYGHGTVSGCNVFAEDDEALALSDAYRAAPGTHDVSFVGCRAQNWPMGTNTDRGGFQAVSTADRISFSDCHTINCGHRAFLSTSTTAVVSLSNCTAVGDDASGAIAFRFGSGGTQNPNVTISNCQAVDYETEFSNGGGTYSNIGRSNWPETFTPTIFGSSSAGAGTYSTQAGWYQQIRGRVFFELQIAWNAHTGTGDMRIATSLPNAGASPTTHQLIVGYSSVTYTSEIQATIAAGGNTILLRQAASNASIAALPIEAGGTILVSGSYPVS